MKGCPVCKLALAPPSQHPGLERTKLLTRNEFVDVHVLLQKCNSCKILLQPTHPCLLNIGDSLLISLGKYYELKVDSYRITTNLLSRHPLLDEKAGA